MISEMLFVLSDRIDFFFSEPCSILEFRLALIIEPAKKEYR